MMPPKKSGDMSAMDELMGSQQGPAVSPAPEEAAEEPAEPKGDPAEMIASIQAQLDELSQLLG